MIGGNSTARMRQVFAAQFADEDNQLVFRANGNGPAILVSPAERDAFIAGYGRFASRWTWQMMGAILVAVIVASVVLFALNLMAGAPAYIGITLALVPVLILSLMAERRARMVPQRLLADRTPIAPALPKAAARAKALRAIPWPSFAAFPAYIAFMLWKYHVTAAPFARDHLAWTALATAAFVLVGVQAFRKLRAEQLDAG